MTDRDEHPGKKEKKKHRAAGLMKTWSIGHISAARKKILLCEEKKKAHNSTHNLCNEARVIQLATSKRWTERFLLDFNSAAHKAQNAFQ